jgi:hypothetical protein
MSDITYDQEPVSSICYPYNKFPPNIILYVPLMSSSNWPSSYPDPFKILYVFLVALIRAKCRANLYLFNFTIKLFEKYNYKFSCCMCLIFSIFHEELLFKEVRFTAKHTNICHWALFRTSRYCSVSAKLVFTYLID